MESGKFSIREFLLATRDGVWAIGAIAIIFGGIYSGVFSPTEAAGIASVYAIFVSYFIYRETTLRQIFETGARAMYLTGLIFIIVSVAGLYAWLLTISGIAQDTVSLISGLHSERWVVLLVITARSRRGFAGHRSDPFRCHRGDEFDDRHVPPALRPEHLRLPGIVQNAITRALRWPGTVCGDRGAGADASHLYSWDFALDHAPARLTTRASWSTPPAK
jgi:hypothetical protein